MEKALPKAFIIVKTMLEERGYSIEDSGNKYMKGKTSTGMSFFVYFTNNLLNDGNTVGNILDMGGITIAKKTGLLNIPAGNEHDPFKFILVNFDEEWQMQKKNAFETSYEANANDKNIKYEYFEMRKMTQNPMTHYLQPSYHLIKANSKEWEEIHKDNLTSNKNINKFCIDDPVVKWLGGESRDIVEINRKDTITYRSIQEKSINLYVAK